MYVMNININFLKIDNINIYILDLYYIDDANGSSQLCVSFQRWYTNS